MATRKKKTQDRSIMDLSGTQEPKAGKTYMDSAADRDREDAKAHHLDKGLTSVKKLAATITKAIAHGVASDNDDIKAMVLGEVADLGNTVRDDARAALRAAKKEKRNLQPT